MKKLISSIVSIILLLSLNMSVVAADQAMQPQPRYINISQISSSLSISSSGRASCGGSFVLYYNYNTNLSIDLQRSKDKNSWTSISSWDKECSSTNIGAIGKDYYVASGYYYRVVTTINVKRGSTSVETANCTSQINYY